MDFNIIPAHIILLLIFKSRNSVYNVHMKNTDHKKNSIRSTVALAVILLLYFVTRFADPVKEGAVSESSAALETSDLPSASEEQDSEEFSFSQIPDWSGSPVYIVNDDVPFFTEEDLADEPYEHISELDELGRCGPATALLHRSMMPDWEREDIHLIKPTGWKQAFYDFMDGDSLYNRSHLIAFMFTGQGANPQNLITGTRYMNAEVMLPYEEEVAEYLRDTGNHVLYRVTPYFKGDDLLASGVLMEARSVEDNGRGIQFCVYCYNVQPGVGIDYSTGRSWALTDEELDSREF